MQILVIREYKIPVIVEENGEPMKVVAKNLTIPDNDYSEEFAWQIVRVEENLVNLEVTEHFSLLWWWDSGDVE